MADAKQLQFGQRLRQIDRTNRSLALGYITTVNHDGLIIARPHRRTSHFPFRGLFLGLLILLAFKGFLYASIGPEFYQNQVTRLQNGTAVEKVGAYIMKADPFTVWLAGHMGTLMK